MSAIRLFLADDHPIVLAGLQQILDSEPDFKVIGTATQSDVVIAAIHVGAPKDWDVAILDLDLPPDGGWLVLETLAAKFPQKPALIYTRKPELTLAVRALKLGAAGYLSKERSTDELIAAIRVAHQGDYYETPAVAEFLRQQRQGSEAEPHERLTAREFAVFSRFSAGEQSSHIAQALGIHPATVSTYLARIREKLGVNSNAEITQYAFRIGLKD